MKDSPEKSGVSPSVPEPVQTDPTDVGKRFQQAYQDYVTALKDCQVDAQQRYIHVHRSYVKDLQSNWVDTQKRWQDINQAYIAQVQDAWGDEQAPKLATEAYRSYAQTLRDTCDDTQKRYQDVHESYQKPVQELVEEQLNNCERAYQNYVSEIKDAWASINPETLDAQTLAAINNSIAAAAWYASYTAKPRSAE